MTAQKSTKSGSGTGWKPLRDPDFVGAEAAMQYPGGCEARRALFFQT